MPLAARRSAIPVGAQSITAFGGTRASSSFWFALDPATKTIEALEVAALFGSVAGEAWRRALDPAARTVDAVEAAAVGRRCARGAERLTDLSGFANAFGARKIVTTIGDVRAGASLTCTSSWVRLAVHVEITGACATGREREHQDRDESTCGREASDQRRTHSTSLEARATKRKEVCLQRETPERKLPPA